MKEWKEEKKKKRAFFTKRNVFHIILNNSQPPLFCLFGVFGNIWGSRLKVLWCFLLVEAQFEILGGTRASAKAFPS